MTGDSARDRLEDRMDRFLEAGLGCRCVSDEPWVTVAESCELVVSLAAVGRTERAREILEWLFQWTDDEGSSGRGISSKTRSSGRVSGRRGPAGAAVLAADAISGLSPAADLFTAPRPGNRDPTALGDRVRFPLLASATRRCRMPVVQYGCVTRCLRPRSSVETVLLLIADRRTSLQA